MFFANCSLRCVYCQNRSIAHEGLGMAISIERLAEIFLELAEDGALNINLVTPAHYVPQIIEALRLARACGLNIPVVYNTSGYEAVPTIKMLAGSVDIFLADFKYAPARESDAARRYSAASDYFEVATSALDEMVSVAGKPVMGVLDDGWYSLRSGVLVRHMLLPGRLADSKLVMRYLWERYGRSVLYSVMSQYTPLDGLDDYPELQQRAAEHDYEELLDYCDEVGMSDYYWQQGDPVGESFIPPFDLTGVRPRQAR